MVRVSSGWLELLFLVLQGSIPGPLFFDIFLAGLFLIVKDQTSRSYADGRTSFIFEDNFDNHIRSLEEASKALFDWFKNNCIKSNPDKCHALFGTDNHLHIKIGDDTTGNWECEKSLGVKINKN